jgi:hypothetical protein
MRDGNLTRYVRAGREASCDTVERSSAFGRLNGE